MPSPEQEVGEILEPILWAFRQKLQATVLNHSVTAYLTGAAQMIEFGRTITTDRPIFFEGPPMQQAVNFANKYAARMVTRINQETKDRLAKVIADGIENKRGIDGLARDIRREFDDMTRVRSKLIARTETNEALSQGSFERGKAMGVTGKSWLTVGDDKVRDAHRRNELAGVIPYNQPFPDGSMFPPGEDPYNCRCVLSPAMLPTQESIRFYEGGQGSGNFGHAGRQGEIGGSGEGGGSPEATARAERARKSYNPATAEKQRIGERNQTQLANATGGRETGDNEAFDVELRGNAIEVKTIVAGKNDKITMHPDSLRRKMSEANARGLATHTVVFDARSNEIFYKQGLGSFRLSNMEKVDNIRDIKMRLR